MGYFDGYDSTPTRGTSDDPSTGSDAPSDGSSYGGGGGGGGGGGSDPVETIRGTVDSGVDTVTDTVDTAVDAVRNVGSGIDNTVETTTDFVTSGANEPSVGDPDFGDATVETGTTPVDVGGDTGNNQQPTGVNQTFVNETTDSGGIVAETPNSSGAVLPGEVAGVDISEQRLDDLSETGVTLNERISDSPDTSASPQVGFGSNPVLDDAAGNTVQGAAQLPSQVESAVEFGQNAPLNRQSVQTAGTVATGAAAATAQKAVTDPAEFTAELGFGAVTGTAGTRAGVRAAEPAPVSTRTARFATGEDSVTTARSLEIGTESTNIRPVSATGLRPQTGTPGVDLDDVDLDRQGEAAGPAFEPETRFEGDVVEQSLRDRGNTEAADRIDAVTSVVDEADSVSTGTVSRQQIEDAVADVERIEGDPTQIVDELAEQDATVFGSGAVRAQRPDFRTPGDVDAVVPESNIAQADARLGGLGDFDLKTPDRFAGLREGENFGFGTRSRSPIDVEDADGLGVNPLGEEIQRKAGASGFLRRRIDQDGELDVGSRPSFDARNPSGFDFGARRKDVTDAAELARVGLGETNPATQQFRDAFGVDEGGAAATVGQRGAFGINIDEFIGGTRAQAGVDLGVGRRLTDGGRRVDAGDSQQLRLDTDTRQQLRAADRDSSPSPSRVRNGDSSPSRVPEAVGGSSVVAISPDSSSPVGFGSDSSVFGGSPTSSSPSPSPTPDDSPSPSPVFGGSSSTSPSPGDSTSPSPTPGQTPTDPSPPTSPTTPPSPPQTPAGGGSPTGSPPGRPPDDPDGQPNRGRPDLDLDPDGERDEDEFAITGLGQNFGSGILSGSEALNQFGDSE